MKRMAQNQCPLKQALANVSIVFEVNLWFSKKTSSLLNLIYLLQTCVISRDSDSFPATPKEENSKSKVPNSRPKGHIRPGAQLNPDRERIFRQI